MKKRLFLTILILGIFLIIGSVSANDLNSTNIVLSNDDNVNKTKTVLTGNDLVLDKNEKSVYEVTLKDSNSKPIANKKLSINFKGNILYTKTTDNDGKVFINVNLGKGIYEVTTSFAGDGEYESYAIRNYVIYKEHYDSNVNINSKNISMYYKDGTRYNVKLTDSSNQPISNELVLIYANGNLYRKTTDSNGETSIAINLNSGNYEFITTYIGQGSYKTNLIANNVNIKSTISGFDIVKYYRNDTQYYAKFLKSDGSGLANTEIKFNINGVKYLRNTDDNGIAKLNINLNPGKYIITAINTNGEMHANNITVLSVLIGRDVNKFYKNNTQYNLKVLNQQGKALNGAKISFNINGILYERTTENGIAKLNINLQPGDYIITAEYNGLKESNKIKVFSVLSASDISMRDDNRTQFKANLVNGKGNPYFNQTINFNINGQLYHRTTDTNGTASLNINLMPGEYIVTSSYNGENIANKITITA